MCNTNNPLWWYAVNPSFIGVKSLGKGITKEGGWMALFKILESLVKSEVELDLEMIAILSKKTSCWHQAVCAYPFLWDPCL